MNLNSMGPSAPVDEQIIDLDVLWLAFSVQGSSTGGGEVQVRCTNRSTSSDTGYLVRVVRFCAAWWLEPH